MTAKDKDIEKEKKPLIKVEEVEEETTDEMADESEASEENVKKDPETKTATPVVSSFSQLDSPPPSPPEEKYSLKDASKKDKTSEVEEVDEEKNISEDTEEETEKTPPAEESSAEDKPKKEQISSDEVKEWLKEVRPDTTREVEKGRGPGGKIIALILIILLVLGVIVGGMLYFQKGVSQPQVQEETPTAIPTESETPTPAEEEEVDLTEIKISILNGSGIVGEAGKVKDFLIENGFSEEKIQTGNADSYDYEDVSISLKAEMSEVVIDAIEESLSIYEIKISEDELQDNSTFDVVIIVGK